MLIKLDEAIAAILAAAYEGSQGEAIVGVDDAAQALRALPTVSDGWQPIATSKQDGSAFYVWWPCWYHFPLIAYWKDYQLRLSDSTQPAPPWQLGEPDGPTHWKPLGPLPAPPSE